MNQKEEPQKGTLENPEVVQGPTLFIARECRFCVESQHLKPQWVNKASVDLFLKRIVLHILPVIVNGELPARRFIHEGLSSVDEFLTLTTYDGCGNEFYKYVFSGLKYSGHTVEFDHTSDKGAHDKILVTFEDVKFTQLCSGE
jgi:hypothetical protein